MATQTEIKAWHNAAQVLPKEWQTLVDAMQGLRDAAKAKYGNDAPCSFKHLPNYASVGEPMSAAKPIKVKNGKAIDPAAMVKLMALAKELGISV